MKKLYAALALALVVTGSWFAYNRIQLAAKGEAYERGEENESPEKEAADARGMIDMFNAMRNDPATGTLPLDAYYGARMDAKHFAGLGMRGALNLQWEEMGPDNQGGRTRAIMADKDDPNVMFAGGVTGGLWKSTNGGGSWNKVNGTDDFANMVVSCITQAPNGNIYFGTGESFGFSTFTSNVTGATGFPGGGVWMSSDHGDTWTNIAAPANTNSASDPWSFVNDIVADPNGIVWIGIHGGSNAVKGLQQLDSNDPNHVVTNAPITASPISAGNAEVTDIECGSDGSVHAVVGNKYFRRLSGEANFTKVASAPFGTPARMEIAIAPSNPNVLYFTTTDGSYLSGVWKSTDGGNNFSQIAGNTTGTSEFSPVSQGAYALATAVHPTNPDVFYLGGLDCYRYTPGSNFVKISNWNYSITSTNYVHADIHNFLFRSDNPNGMYVVSDGGINYTSNAMAGNVVWSTKNNGYITTQFYSCAAKNYTGELVGGTQDNGNWLIDYNGNTIRWGQMIKGGDGGDVAVSTIKPNLIFAEYVYAELARSSNNGASFGNMLDTHIDPESDGMVGTPDNPAAPFIAQIKLWENVGDTGLLTQSKLFLGTQSQVWMTQGALDLSKTPTWFKLVDATSYTGSTLGSGEVTAIAVSPSGDMIYVGTSGGKLFRISGLDSVLQYQPASSPAAQVAAFHAGDHGVHVTMVKNFGSGRYITGLDIDDNNADHVVVTLGNYGSTDHVYQTIHAVTDSIPTFTNLSGNGLPSMPVYSCLIDRHNPNNILIGTELGVYSTNDGGSHWSIEDDGLPHDPVMKLYNYKLNDGNSPTGSVDNVVLAATYGRGLFRTRSLQFTSVNNGPNAGSARLLGLYPNPAGAQTNLTLMLDRKTDLRVDVYSLDGKSMKTLSFKNQTPGQATLAIATNDLPNGTYLMKVSGSGLSETRKLMVVR